MAVHNDAYGAKRPLARAPRALPARKNNTSASFSPLASDLGHFFAKPLALL